jgi:hypothetical protein
VLARAVEVADTCLRYSFDQSTSESLIELSPLARLRPSLVAGVHFASCYVFVGSRRS